MEPDLPRRILRWLAGIGFWGLALFLAKSSYDRGDLSRLFLVAVPLFACGFAILWRPIFDLATRPLVWMIDAVFFPGGRLEKPMLNLKLPSYYLNQERYSEARAEYWKIIRHHPDETEAYEKLIWLALEIFEDPREAEKVLRKARKRNLALDGNYDRMIQTTTPARD